MFAIKNNYYLYIENTKDLNLNLIKKRQKFTVIYRNNTKYIDLEELILFRKKCRQKGVSFYVANNLKLSMMLKANGLYVSSYNKNLNVLNLKNNNFKIIGSAHNIKEYAFKLKQGCEKVIFSRLFETKYKNKKTFLGINKFNFISNFVKKELIPLGGIRLHNLNSLKMVRSNSFALLSELKKKPAISNRLF